MGKGKKKMGKGKKKRGTSSGGNASLSAHSLSSGTNGLPFESEAEHSHGVLQHEQVELNLFNAGKTFVETAFFADDKSKAPKKTSSVPCRFFQRGHCRYGDFCRFQHLGSASASTEPLDPAAKKPLNGSKASSKTTCAPEECLDWHLTGSCPRYRTCRYAHPAKGGKAGSSGNPMAELLLRGLMANGGEGGRDDLMDERMANGGFTDDDVYELSLQGIKPWDPEAMDALAVLKGWDVDDYDDYDDGLC